MNDIVIPGIPSANHDVVRIENINGKWRCEVVTAKAGMNYPPYYTNRADAVKAVRTYLQHEAERKNTEAKRALALLEGSLQPVQLSLFAKLAG